MIDGIHCPRCKAAQSDYDGLVVLYCPHCKYCATKRGARVRFLFGDVPHTGTVKRTGRMLHIEPDGYPGRRVAVHPTDILEESNG